MIEFIKMLGFYLLIYGSIIAATLVVYYILQYLAKQNVETELQAQREELDQHRNKLNQRAQKLKAVTEQRSEMFLQKEQMILSKHQEATEMLKHSEEFREMMESKLDRVRKINTRLREDLQAARQRAKRLANKAKCGINKLLQPDALKRFVPHLHSYQNGCFWFHQPPHGN